MSAKSGIEWTESTWNIVDGCTPKSAGCRECWAKKLHDMRHRAFLAGKKMPKQYAKPFSVVQLLDERMEQPLHWKQPRRVFVASTADLFHDEVPFSYINRAFEVMQQASWHTFQVLTKRPERMLMWARQQRKEPIPANVWGGVSVENQAAADERIPLLIQVGFALNFVSCEPLLGPVNFDLCGWNNGISKHINWVIAGGESGSGARPMYVDWVRYLQEWCEHNQVPFYFKQWGEWLPDSQMGGMEMLGKHYQRWPDGSGSLWVGKERAGQRLDGVAWRQMP